VTYRPQLMEGVTGEYDGVWCYNVLDHTADWRISLGSLCAVVKPGGQLWLMTHCRPAERIDLHHTQSYNPLEVLAFLQERGFKFEHTHTETQIGTGLTELYVRGIKR